TLTNDSVTMTPMPRPPARAPARFVGKPTTTSIMGQERNVHVRAISKRTVHAVGQQHRPAVPELLCDVYSCLHDAISEASGPHVSALLRTRSQAHDPARKENQPSRLARLVSSAPTPCRHLLTLALATPSPLLGFFQAQNGWDIPRNELTSSILRSPLRRCP
ncbi:hypothetical protein DFH06DRAFT_1171070, partial [Mycena polygramma]